jgi:hypothetical protein
MIINFKEIPLANSGEGNQDTFENFTKEFLELYGFQIIESPSRGADGGLDLKVKEVRSGIGGFTDVIWLVSCKHFAHSGKAISGNHELNISDRVRSNKCNGFIGFYSSVPSSGLIRNFSGLSDIEFKIFDKEDIEKEIIGINKMERLFARYFPESYKKWINSFYYTEPIGLVEYFFEKEYVGEGYLLKNICGNTGRLIKELRVTNTLKDLIHKEGFEIIEKENLTIELLSADFVFMEYLNRKLPEIVFKDFKVEVIGKPILLSISNVDMHSYILYPKILVLDSKRLIILEDLFNKLKGFLS